MTPMQLIEGSRTKPESMRLLALAKAVRQHQATAGGHNPADARAHDRRLYRSLHKICGEQSGR